MPPQEPGPRREIRVMLRGGLLLAGCYLLVSLPDGGPGALEFALVLMIVLLPIALVAPASRLAGGGLGLALAATGLGVLAPVALPPDALGAGPIDAATLVSQPGLLGYLVVLVLFLGLALEGLRRVVRWNQARRDGD